MEKTKMNNMDIIEINGMEFYSYHGCFKEEQVIGNKFLVDLWIETNATKPALSDNIDDAVNYQTAYTLIKKEMTKKSHLLENIAFRILNSIHNNLSGIHKVKVKVSKINPPIGGKTKSVSLIMER